MKWEKYFPTLRLVIMLVRFALGLLLFQRSKFEKCGEQNIWNNPGDILYLHELRIKWMQINSTIQDPLNWLWDIDCKNVYFQRYCIDRKKIRCDGHRTNHTRCGAPDVVVSLGYFNAQTKAWYDSSETTYERIKMGRVTSQFGHQQLAI